MGNLLKNTHMHLCVYLSRSFEIDCACLRVQETCIKVIELKRTKNGPYEV